ncbi:unnamed protein product, partial [Mesorhabditis belari]|uniref:SXP/RAL-2 family protein Ani s 5-like cation-binding domain-containing protein n=1 Tax=Mesorhabditis belari TaxID=2138241 RepID=A0AAF3FIC8_9BILA
MLLLYFLFPATILCYNRRFFESRQSENFLEELQKQADDSTTIDPEEILEEKENKIKATTKSIPLTQRECTGALSRIPKFVEELDCTAADEWKKIVETQTEPRSELKEKMRKWALKYNVEEELINWLNAEENLYNQKGEKYQSVLNGVWEMINKIDDLARNETLSRSEERLAVSQLYENEDKIVIEVVNLVVQLVRSWAGEKFPFRKMRPLEGVQIWTEI